MKNTPLLTCYIVGKDTLLLECAKILLSQSFLIKGIISPSNTIKKWAHSQKIDWFTSLAEIDFTANPADYLFSIVNNDIIPFSVLQHIRQLAINYHDAPLPRYAGSNATSWALLNNEASHGVTWHVITDRIDAGDILKSISIPVLPDETALQLNINCVEQAIISFADLVNELVYDSYQKIPQDLTRRSYFSRAQKPVGNGWVNWNDSAEEIERLWRATQLGHYRNSFTVLKMVLQDTLFIIDTLNVFPKQSTKPPGSIIEINSHHWKIATATNDILITKIIPAQQTMAGLETIATNYGITIGSILASPSAEIQQQFLTLSQNYFSYESAWVEMLARFQPTTATSSSEVNWQALPQPLLDRCQQFNQNTTEVPLLFLTAWIIYLHRLGNQAQLGVYVHFPQNSIPTELHPFFASFLPFSMTINGEENFLQLLENVRQTYTRLAQQKTYLNDIWQRYPELNTSTPPKDQTYQLYLNSNIHHIKTEVHPLPESFIALFTQLLSHPEQSITEINWVSQQERQQLLIDWNNTDTAFPAHKTIHQLFEEQADKTPDQLALIFQDINLSYQDLNLQANQLAHYLKLQHHIEPDQLVTVYLERSQWMLIALLSILKAGGAYVPLDTDYPANRITYILNESAVSVIVTTQKHAHQLRNIPGIDWQKITILVIDHPEFARKLAQQSTMNPMSATTSRHLAYVMYTSGTTGTPKGVQIEHQGIVNRLCWMNNAYPLRSTDKVLQKTPYVFDVSVWELFWANWYGAAIVICAPEKHKEPLYLRQLIDDAQISIIHFTPSMLNVFVQTSTKEESCLSSLRHVFLSGEPLDTATFNKIQTRLPKAAIHNLYGPTETSIDVLSYHCIEQQPVYLGKPIANIRAYVLDEKLQLLPVGIKGELHIAGVGLARGYLNQRELTSKKFISNPFQTEQDKQTNQYARLYKTGDLVRWLPNGNLDYLGRNDTQIKLRGFRIELSEIEHILHCFPEIRQSIVVVTDNKLSAYYTAQQPLDAEKIRAYVKSYLPKYMVPDQFIFLNKFPLTINGKVDQKKLPLFSSTCSKLITQPVNETQTQITAIVAAVLDLEPSNISITDNFFKLGGDSILAIRLVSRLNMLFQQSIQVKNVLELKTIQAISTLLNNQKHAKKPSEINYRPFSLIDTQSYQDQLKDDLIEDIYPASYLQMGMLIESSLNDNGTYHDVFYYEINLPFEQERFLTTWNALAQKHALLRARFLYSTQHGLEVVIFKQPHLSYQLVDNQPLQQLIDIERLNHFSHTEECLFHLIINRHTAHFDFIFSFHHAIVDGWSVASLINEFALAYANDQTINQDSTPLLSYGEFVQNELHSLNDKTSMSFWKSYLARSEPTQAKWKFDDITTSPNSLFNYAFSLDSEEANSVQQLAREHAVSVDTVFMYAYLKTLSFFLNSANITIGVVFNNRLEKLGGDSLFGLFLNVLPLRLQLEQDASVQKELIKTFNAKINLYEHKHIPYARLKSEFNRDLYQFGFNFIHFHVFKQSEKIITKRGGFDRTSIPFLLEVTQWNGFKVELKAHDNYISQDYLNYFGDYFKTSLFNLLQNKNELSLHANDIQKIVIDWNATDKPFPHEKMLHQLFEEQVQRTPDATALVYEDKQLTYQTLNQQANQLAHYLLQHFQVKPDELIALCLDRNELMVIAILAVLKSGAAYVPIEPGHPDERISYILHDTKTRLVLTNIVHEQRIHSSLCHVVALDNPLNQYQCQLQPLSNPLTAANSRHLAYVIYTSGTTGKPNGVMIEHKGVVNFILDVIEKHKLYQNKHVAFYSNYAFDASVYELFPALASGCKVFLLLNPVRHDLQRLTDYFKKNAIQNSFIPSSLATDFIQTCKVDSLEFIHVAGDRLILDSEINIDDLNYELINEYGATEASICTTYTKVSKTKMGSPNTNIIGHPFANNKCYIVHVNGQLAPVGAIGELFIGGTGLARGYLHNLELTRRKFIQNPFQTDEEKKQGLNQRLYKTGDLARFLPDGNLEYIARNDTQIKIWGYRIELSEIEQVLNSHPDIKQSIVLRAHEHPDSTTRSNHLIAYYVKKTPDEKEISNHNNPVLRAYLETQLPRYMLPHYFIPLQKLPLTINSKVDRDALPKPIFSPSDSYIPPQTQMELTMCALFAQALGLPKEKIGITDDFSAQLGGSSIQAIKLMTQVNRTFKTTIFLKSMLTHGTVQKLLSIIETNLNER